MNNSIGYVRSLALGLVSLALAFTAYAATEPAGSMAGVRSSFGAAPLADGRALVVGGYGSTGLMYSAEIFDPAAATFSATGSLITPRGQPAAAPLADGRVLVLGGRVPAMPTTARCRRHRPRSSIRRPEPGRRRARCPLRGALPLRARFPMAACS